MRAPLCGPVLALALLAATPSAAQEPPNGGSAMGGYAAFKSLTCIFEAVEGAQLARTVTVQRGDDAEFEWKGAAEPHYAWLEQGRPPLPVWSATVEPPGVVTVQSWTVGGVTDMVTVHPNGRAVLSTHDSVSDPEQIIWSASIGQCTTAQGG